MVVEVKTRGEHDLLHFPRSQIEAIDMMLHGSVAWNDERNPTITLRRSRGHRRSGRKTRYTVHYGPYNGEGDKGWFHLTALDDDEALEKANGRLTKR